MRIISSGLLMISAAGIIFGLIHLRFWLSQLERKDQFAFSLASISLAIFAWFEVGLMRAETPEEYGLILKWAQPVAAVVVISSAWFMKENLGGRSLLFWLIFALGSVTVLLNLFTTPNINYSEISSLGSVVVLGESLAYAKATPHPLSVIPQTCLLLLILYAADSSYRLWLRGERRKAATFGAGSLAFTIWVIFTGASVQFGIFPVPLIVSPSLLFLAAPMLFELNYDVQRSVELSKKLLERERELQEALDSTNLSSAAAHVGLWTRNAGEEEIFLSDKAREIFGFPPNVTATFTDFASRVHPEDRDRLTRTIRAVENDGGEYQIEYRILLDGGQIKWIDSRGKVIAANGRPRALHGASLDITSRKKAEYAVHELSGKLMDAQEKERARLARELHDDLSQRLALLSVRLEVLKSMAGTDAERFREIEELIANIKDLSADMHRISHELHPAKLHQLGLEAAVRGFCREVSTTHPVKISFFSVGIPRELPNHISLALYRIVQESLQNVVKHSRATAASVKLAEEEGELVVIVSDNGSGFDPNGEVARRSLGITSMEERVSLIKGTFLIESGKGNGTRVEARVPILSERGKAGLEG